MGQFGTGVNAAHFVEYAPSGGAGLVAGSNVPDRPAAGVTMRVRATVTKVALDPITITPGGHWAASYSGVDMIDVSTDAGTTWQGPLISSELTTASANASAKADAASAKADQAIAAVGTVQTPAATAVTYKAAASGPAASAGTVQDAVDALSVAVGSGGGSGGSGGSGSVLAIRYIGGAYEAVPATPPAGVKVLEYIGPSVPPALSAAYTSANIVGIWRATS